MTKESLNQLFKNIFSTDASIFVKSPGRINIIGEHTDYNNGFVLPAAIDKYIYVAISPRLDNKLHLYSGDYKESYDTLLNQTHENAPEWAKYIIGVAEIIDEQIKAVKGFNLFVSGDVPLGAGLSSSAAFSCATAFAINELFKGNLSRIELAKIAQQTEHEYIGLKCGIMDQFASLLGRNNHAIQLDCQDLSYEYVAIDWSSYEILLMNTNVKHSLASSAYNDRRAACEEGVRLVKGHIQSVNSLRDVTVSQLDQYVKPVDEDIYTKCRFVVEENQRLLAASTALNNNDIEKLGELLFQAHWALSKEYEVSCPELDFLVQQAQNNPNVIGARMMGGGFGGCTINIIRKGHTQEVIDSYTVAYKREFGIEPTPIQISLGNGTSFL